MFQPPPASSAPVVVAAAPKPVVAPAPIPAPVPPPAVKPVATSASLPKLTQPMPLASRPPLPNVARGVAAAFLEHEDDEAEMTASKISLGGATSMAAVTASTAKKADAARSTVPTKPPQPVPPPASSALATASKSLATKTDFMIGLSGMTYSDMVLAAQMQNTATGDGKAAVPDPLKTRTARVAKAARSRRTPTDSHGRKKLEIGRNVM